jgi:hypothetical protein
MQNRKMRPAETIPGMGKGGVKDNDEGGEFNYDIVKNFCQCHNVPPNNNLTIKREK